jgi:hypothetical protein
MITRSGFEILNSEIRSDLNITFEFHAVKPIKGQVATILADPGVDIIQAKHTKLIQKHQSAGNQIAAAIVHPYNQPRLSLETLRLHRQTFFSEKLCPRAST